VFVCVRPCVCRCVHIMCVCVCHRGSRHVMCVFALPLAVTPPCIVVVPCLRRCWAGVMQNPCAHFGCVLLHQPRPTWEFAGRGNQVMRCVCVYLLSFASSFLPFASCSLIESINQSMKLSDLPSPLLSSPRFTITTNGIYSPAYATSPLPVPIQPWDPLSSLTEYPKYRSTYSSRPLPYSRLTCPPAFESPNPADWLHLSYLTALSLFIPQALSCGEILAFFPPSYFFLPALPAAKLTSLPTHAELNDIDIFNPKTTPLNTPPHTISRPPESSSCVSHVLASGLRQLEVFQSDVWSQVYTR